VDDGLLRTGDGLVGAGDQVLARLRQDLDRDVIRDDVLLDELADEVEVGLTRRGEADFDLLVPHADEQLEHDALALGRHGVDEGLVAVAEVDGAPAGRLGDAGIGPGAVGQVDGDLLVEGPVLVDRHRGRALGVLHDGASSLRQDVRANTSAATRKALALGLVAAAKKKQTAERHVVMLAGKPRAFRRLRRCVPARHWSV